MITGTWFFLPLVTLFMVLAFTNAIHDEKKIMSSPLAGAYSAYAETVTSRFIPHLL